ncbi:unnamed protein product, partial [Brassica rapa]
MIKRSREAKSSNLNSQSYASSIWCLNELVEILKCKETAGQIIGKFGEAFKKTCEGRRTQAEIQSWSRALTDVANIKGEHSLNW